MSIWKCICPQCSHVYYDAFFNYSDLAHASVCPVCNMETLTREAWMLPEGETWTEDKLSEPNCGECEKVCDKPCFVSGSNKSLDV